MFIQVTRDKQVIKELAKIGKNLSSISLQLPTEEQINQGIMEMREYFPTNKFVHRNFVRNALMALEYAKCHSHYKTGTTLINDILSRKHIFLNSYDRVS